MKKIAIISASICMLVTISIPVASAQTAPPHAEIPTLPTIISSLLNGLPIGLLGGSTTKTTPTKSTTTSAATTTPTAIGTIIITPTKITSYQLKADSYITERTGSLQSLIDKIQSSSIGSTTAGQTDIASVNQVMSELTGLKGQVNGLSTSNNTALLQQIKPLLTTLFSQVKVYATVIPELHAQEYLQNISAQYESKLAPASQNMQKDITYAQNQGKDTTQIEADYQKFLTDSEKLTYDMQGAASAVNSVQVTGSSSSLKSSVVLIHQDFLTVMTDFKTFVKDFKNLFPTTTTVTTTP